MQLDEELRALDAHYRSMPPVAAMDIAIAGRDVEADTLTLRAPLALNVNDKACAFGGSLVSLLTLAGWGLVTLRCHQLGIDADVFVADSEIRYLAPLYADLRATAALADGSGWAPFDQALRSRGRARVRIAASVPLPDGGVATTLRAGYAAIARG
ncbi:YiiD C-terminal domain-containing protein [Luteimonas sp. Sa2BVA3]|jgi:thioesterase domain-containing protein|uniref:YiiD C-terminal domain-containing protein n=1 Tax=Luteimonas colneyensis TaxID=2762230 RepID=A0ABR8UHT6_9GAMM|nr:YiiD C-terminal domain-containing protein [Luteimonas colneyensis]MBD7987563.1 YiiD C-terminal domain-containing protein [Luteimonas colneyensis]